MITRAVSWVESALGCSIVDVDELTGGLTSTMVHLRSSDGDHYVVRLMTREPWRSAGAELTARERAAQMALASTPVPAPTSLALDAEGGTAGAPAHLMTLLPGQPREHLEQRHITEMVDRLGLIHRVRPSEKFRDFQSWAWEAKWVVPPWTRHPDSWSAAFAMLAQTPPAYRPTFIHRDFSHRNLLWTGESVTGVVDWVETSTGPAWLDAAHAATNLAVAGMPGHARDLLDLYSVQALEPRDSYWLVMDAVGFLPAPGRAPLFDSLLERQQLDAWLHAVVVEAI